MNSDTIFEITCMILGLIWIYIVGFMSGYLWIKKGEGSKVGTSKSLPEGRKE